MACEAPPVPPQLEQQRQICSEYSNPHSEKGRAIIESCKQVWEDYNRIRGDYDKCVVREKTKVVK